MAASLTLDHLKQITSQLEPQEKLELIHTLVDQLPINLPQNVSDEVISQTGQDAVHTWSQCLAIIKKMIHPRTYETWFKPTCAVSLSEDVLTLQVPTQFIVDWLQEHHMPMLNQVFARQCGRSVRINFQVVERSLA